MLDTLNEFCKEQHLITIGVCGLVLLFIFHLIFKDVVGRWKWHIRKKKGN